MKIVVVLEVVCPVAKNEACQNSRVSRKIPNLPPVQYVVPPSHPTIPRAKGLAFGDPRREMGDYGDYLDATLMKPPTYRRDSTSFLQGDLPSGKSLLSLIL